MKYTVFTDPLLLIFQNWHLSSSPPSSSSSLFWAFSYIFDILNNGFRCRLFSSVIIFFSYKYI
uniref:Uncharacterized protein n=1 Tax=Octopus bimaculoides TaxID=37653 RepID=A0A0L8I146_OCTBM